MDMKSKIALIVVGMGLASLSLQAQSFVYNGFSDTADLTLNGNATTTVTSDGTVLRLTPAAFDQAGSAFSTTKINLQNNASFSTAFTFRFTSPGGWAGPAADGIVFTVQNDANNVGSAGGGIGFEGVSPSLGVEWDTYDNGGPDSPANHVAVDLNGVLNNDDKAVVSPNFYDGNLWYGWVDYNGLTNSLQVRTSEDSNRPAAALIDYNVDLVSLLGESSAYVGFTAATGKAYENHDIVSWQFNDDYKPISKIGNSVPADTSTLALFGLAFVGLAMIRRRIRD
jgi:hypothetical protein